MPFSTLSRSAAAGLCAVALITTLSPGVIAVSPQNGPQLIRLKYPQGRVTKYTMVMGIKMHAEGLPAGASMPTEPNSFSAGVKQTVLQVYPDGSAKIKSVLTGVKKPKGGNSMISIANTDNPKPITMIMDTRGAVKKIEGMPEQNQFSAMFSKIFGGAAPFVFLPEDPVSPGDTWQSAIDVPGFSTGGTVDSTLLRIDIIGGHTTAVITFVINMPLQLDPSMFGGSAQGAQGMNVSGTLTGTGAVHLDLTTGLITLCTSDDTMGMSLAFAAGTPGAQQLPNGMKINVDMHTKLRQVM